MGKHHKKQSYTTIYSRRGGSVYIEIRDENQRKQDTFKFGVNDKELGNRILYDIAMKYGFVLPTMPRPQDIIIEYKEEEEETYPGLLLEEDNEGQKNKEFLAKLSDKIFKREEKEK